MMKRITLFMLAALFSATTFAQDLSLDQILKNYYETTGLDKMKDVETLTVHGKSVTMGQEFPFTMYKKRPDKFRLEVPIQGATMIQVYSDNSGWMVMPWTGTTDPKDMTADQLKGFKKETDFEGPLYNWKEKGNKVELMGKEDMEGSEVYVIKVTDTDNDITTYYMDAENFVVLKTKTKTTMRGQEVESETYFSNYQEQDGFVMAHSIEVKNNGQTGQSMELTEIIYNEPVDDKLFVKPAPAPKAEPAVEEKK